MKTMRNIVAFAMVLMIARTAQAVNYPKAGGDIADNTATGWNGSMPDSSTKANFNQAGTYTASTDVHFGEFSVQANSTFNLYSPETRTVKASMFYMGCLCGHHESYSGDWHRLQNHMSCDVGFFQSYGACSRQ